MSFFIPVYKNWLNYLPLSLLVNGLLFFFFALGEVGEKAGEDYRLLRVSVFSLLGDKQEYQSEKKNLSAPALEPIFKSEKTQPIAKSQKLEQSVISKSQEFSKLDSKGSNLSEILEKRHFLSQNPPIYPRRAIELGQQGKVTILGKISKKGKLFNLKISQSSGFSLLDRAALSAVKEWKFNLLELNPVFLSQNLYVPVNFSLKQNE